MSIYPKISEYLDGEEILKERYIEESKGIEIQFLEADNFNKKHIEEIISGKMEQFPMLEEITIHPPITSKYNFETLMFANYSYVEELLKTCIDLSKKFNNKINLLFHIEWDLLAMKQGPIDKMQKLLKNIKEEDNVQILLENTYPINKVENCTVLQVADLIDNPKLKVCIDICHLHCHANIFKKDFQKFLETYLNKELCQKHVYQIHFSATLKNDGYADKKTHGRMHESFEDLIKDYYVIQKFGMTGKNIITEVSEEDYSSRKDQVKEIQMLMEISNESYQEINKYA